MRKVLLFILILILSLASLTAMENKVELVIKAYKLDKDSLEGKDCVVEITDAISDSLNILKENGKGINITNSMEHFVGDIDNPPPDEYGRYVVFSYRVYGNKLGSYSLSFEFDSPFVKTEGEHTSNILADSKPETQRAGFAGFIKQQDYRFSSIPTGATEQRTEVDSESFVYQDERYKIAENPSASNKEIRMYADYYSSKSLKASFIVSKDDDSSTEAILPGTDTMWITRGSIGMTVNNDRYKNLETGTYKVNVKVKLEVV